MKQLRKLPLSPFFMPEEIQKYGEKDKVINEVQPRFSGVFLYKKLSNYQACD